MTDKKKIADRIRSSRELAGLSQAQAAKILGLHRPTVSEIEAGRRHIKASELARFADLYGVEISWIIEGKVKQEKLSQEILAAARELDSMSKDDLDILINTIQVIKSKRGNIE